MSHPKVRRPLHRVIAGISVAILTATLAACSATADEPNPKPTSNSDGSTPDVLPERDFALAIQSAPNSFDPAQLSDGQQTFVWGSLYDTLLVRENGTGELKPNAAESWEYNADGSELVLKLRDDLTFSDGSEVTADDVAATLLRTKNTPGLQQGKFALVDDVVAEDGLTVKVTFTEFDPAFLPTLAFGIGVIGDAATLDDDRTALDPIGSGPYILDTAATVPGTTYVLTRRDDHWDAENYPFSTVTVRVLADPTASLNALQAGEIQAATVRPQQMQALGDDFDFTPISAQGTGFFNIIDRGGDNFPELGDVRVRQAIAHAIDRQGILEALLMGAGQVSNQIFSPFGSVNDPALDSTYEYDPQKSKDLLADAGFGNGLTLDIPSTFITTAFEPILTEQLKEVGITLNWVAVPPQQAQTAVQSGEFGIAYQVIGFASDQSDAKNYYGVGGYNNPNNFTDETLTDLFEKIHAEVDFETALPLYKELNEYAVEQSLVVPIVFNGTTWATRDGVTYLDNGANGIQSIRLFGVVAE